PVETLSIVPTILFYTRPSSPVASLPNFGRCCKIMTTLTWFKQKCVNCAPQRRRSPVGGGPTHVVVGKHGSYRAAWPGNRPGRSLGTRVRLWAGCNLAGRNASEA